MSNIAESIAGIILTDNDRRTNAIETILGSLKSAYLNGGMPEGAYVNALEWLRKTTSE